MRSLVGLFLPLFCIVDLGMSNGMIPSRLLIMPGVEHSADCWGKFVLVCAKVLQWSHISGGRHLKAQSLV